jgi:hypothetical protein
MRSSGGRIVLRVVVALMLARACGEAQLQNSSKAASPEMSEYQRDVEQYPEAALFEDNEIPGSGADSSPHIYMTLSEPRNPEDDRRAAAILDILRKSLSRYRDYKVALADGYQIFMPRVTQLEYHFTNYHWAFAAPFLFNPGHPTALLYRKTKDGYELQGAMFTAPKNATRQQLNDRIPLSVARWHEHVNMCVPPKGTPTQQIDWKRFGLGGSIAKQDTCLEAGGHWVAQVFGWMVYIYPFESDPNKIWPH